jgi:hypothetical protein
VTNTVLYSYVIGWIITSVGLALSARVRSRRAIFTVAGAAWPLLVLGAVQLAAVVLVTEVVRLRDRGRQPIVDEFDELFDEWQATGAAMVPERRSPAVTGRDNTH